MIILANAMLGLAALLGSLFWIMQILIIARVVISWVNADQRNRIVQFIVGSTEPMLGPIRKRIPIIGGGLDISPIVLLFGIIFLQYALVNSMQEYALYMKASQRVPIQSAPATSMF